MFTLMLRFLLFATFAGLSFKASAKDFDAVVTVNGKACVDRLRYDTGNTLDGTVIAWDCASLLGLSTNAAGDVQVPAGTPEFSPNNGGYRFYCFTNCTVMVYDDQMTACTITQQVYIPKNPTNPAANAIFRSSGALNADWINAAKAGLIGAGHAGVGLWPDKIVARLQLPDPPLTFTNVTITNRFTTTTNGGTVTNDRPRLWRLTNTPPWDPRMALTNYGYPGPYGTNMMPRPFGPVDRPDGWHRVGDNKYAKVNPDGTTLTVTNTNPSINPTNAIAPGTNGWVTVETNSWILTGTNTVIPFSTNGWRLGTNGWTPLGTNGWVRMSSNGWSRWYTNFPGNTNWGGSVKPNTNGYFINPKDGDFPIPNPFEGSRTNVFRTVRGRVFSAFGSSVPVTLVHGGLSEYTFVPRPLVRALETVPRGIVTLGENEDSLLSLASFGISPPFHRQFEKVDLFVEIPGLGHKRRVSALILENPWVDFVIAGADFLVEQYAMFTAGDNVWLAFAPLPSPRFFQIAVDSVQVVLQWADMGLNSQYVVEASADPVRGPWLPAINVEWPTSDTSAVLDADQGRSVYYRVRAYNWRAYPSQAGGNNL